MEADHRVTVWRREIWFESPLGLEDFITPMFDVLSFIFHI